METSTIPGRSESQAAPVPAQPGGRRLLLAGFGGLLLLMAVAGVDALMVLRQVRTSDAQERNLYLRRATALDIVRTGIYQSAIDMRAYLLADTTRDAAAQLAQWEVVRGRTDQALNDSAAVLDSADAPQLASLRSEVQDYWRLLEFLATIPEGHRRVLGGEYLNREVVRRRGATLDLVDRIDQMNARQMAAGDAQLNSDLQYAAVAAASECWRRRSWSDCCWRLLPSGARCGWKKSWSSAIRKARAPARNSRISPRGWFRPRKKSAAPSRESCTMKWASRFPPC